MSKRHAGVRGMDFMDFSLQNFKGESLLKYLKSWKMFLARMYMTQNES
jgi:hypothetical protein